MNLPVALFFVAYSYSYWVEPCSQSGPECQAGDVELAELALRAWSEASAGALRFSRATQPEQARIRLYWAGAREGLYGEARPVTLKNGQRGAEVYVRPAPLDPQDPLLRDAIVYLTCVHETGHALGLAHTASFDDIMYSFQFGGDIPEYFNRYRRLLKTRADIPKHVGLSGADRAHLKSALERENAR